MNDQRVNFYNNLFFKIKMLFSKKQYIQKFFFCQYFFNIRYKKIFKAQFFVVVPNVKKKYLNMKI